LSCPLIFFQGLQDQVVPANQARAIADAVRAKGLAATLLIFDNEQHGFRQGETIVRCLEAELFFYATTFAL
jgi:dipeptidyl aminopeptidase/acylaminoacyl peptidase